MTVSGRFACVSCPRTGGRLLDERAGKAIGAIWGTGLVALAMTASVHAAACTQCARGTDRAPWTAGDVFCQLVLERFACGASR